MTASKNFLKVFYLLIITIGLLFWLEQRSINAYWVQTYHRDSPISSLNHSKIWREGGEITSFLSAYLELLQSKAMSINEDVVTNFNSHLLQPQGIVLNNDDVNYEVVLNMEAVFQADILYIFPQKPFIKILEVKEPVSNEAFIDSHLLVVHKEKKLEPLESNNSNELILIEKGQKVFFVGDSLMQGVAPHVMRVLLKQHGIESINLSKQSTGLSYPKFYNWPEVAKDTIIKNPDIKLMIVFMGPNDPWDFPVDKSKRFFRFKTPEWEGVYRARIQELIDAAATRGAKVLWVGAPNVKNDRLNEGMLYLNTIYQSQVAIAKQHYTTSNDALGMQDDKFVKFMRIPNRGNVTLRTDDGTHFTIIGQKRIADKIISLLRFDGVAE